MIQTIKKTSTILIAIALLSTTAWCRDRSKKPTKSDKATFPPQVVKTVPANLADNVDFTITEIKVTFDRKMQSDKAWSWIIHQNLGVYPGYRPSPDPKWEDGGKTCVLSVKLSPDTLYAVGVNSYRHNGFKDVNGKVAIPHIWVFKTKKAK